MSTPALIVKGTQLLMCEENAEGSYEAVSRIGVCDILTSMRQAVTRNYCRCDCAEKDGLHFRPVLHSLEADYEERLKLGLLEF
jgi:hypothetical protein